MLEKLAVKQIVRSSLNSLTPIDDETLYKITKAVLICMHRNIPVNCLAFVDFD